MSSASDACIRLPQCALEEQADRARLRRDSPHVRQAPVQPRCPPLQVTAVTAKMDVPVDEDELGISCTAGKKVS
jgi:hypothetical protein